ncbi:MAG: hypothetical protein QF811_07090 [Candidatus Woesearchaeota archaeon]|jgi:hypothetical protein|nr:hypothetical protein [Candidatus Woesearchaeota archaeon]
MEAETSEGGFVDPEKYAGGQEQVSFKGIILQHLQRITRLSSVEWRGGYFQIKTHTSGMEDRFYIGCTRSIYSNAVDCLADLLLPLFDEEMQKEEDQLQKELENIRDRLKEEGDKDIGTSYRMEKVVVKRKLFRALCKFLHRMDYLAIGKTEE